MFTKFLRCSYENIEKNHEHLNTNEVFLYFHRICVEFLSFAMVFLRFPHAFPLLFEPPATLRSDFMVGLGPYLFLDFVWLIFE